MPTVIAVQPVCERYLPGTPQSLLSLRRRLSAQSAAQPVPITKPEDVLLDADGLVQGQYRFTTTGLSGLCKRLATGLTPLVYDLAGLKESASTLPADTALAIRVLNMLIRQRFHLLAGYRLVVDSSRETVDGLVGARYEFLHNSKWLAECHAFVHDCSQGRSRFLEASLHGRRLMLRYVDDASLVSLPAPDGSTDDYRIGWNFGNSETGECSVYVGLLLVDASGAACLHELNRRTHIKGVRQSGKRVLRLLSSAYEKCDAAKIRRMFERLRNEPLLSSSDTTSVQRAAKSLSRRLSRRLKLPLASTVVNRTFVPAVAMASGAAARWDARVFPEIVDSEPRSQYHLYCSLTSCARGQAPAIQETAEKLAYDLLRGAFTI